MIFLFSLSLIISLRLCQPIVFVSDRARANKEIEHDGIQGEKRKPKVTIVPGHRYTFIFKK